MKKNHELFKRDPKTTNLVNDGQARILNNAGDQRAIDMLRYELEHFVCEGQYAAGTKRILNSFLSNLNQTAQRAAWVSGFYGSGKSHLLKMLCHLWVNTSFSDGATARALAPDLPDDVIADLKELDNQGKRTGGSLFAASGTMPEGSSESARLTVLGILFRACELPSAFNQAAFCLYLRDKGFFETVRDQVEQAGRDFHRELDDLYVSPHIRRALLECDTGLGDEREVRQLLRDQFPPRTDIDSSEFIRRTKEVLKQQGDGEIPLTIIVLDEVQHYIGDDKDRSKNITELTEALNKQMDSRVLVVGAGQNALSTDTPQFSWLRDRFTIRVELSDTDVETVTRKVLLAKKPQAVSPLESELQKHVGEIERHLVKSNIGPTARDRDWLVPDYPILPTRRRFWEAALRSVDPSGSSALLRTQLRITHEALRQVADKAIGHAIPSDFMFFQQQTGLVQQGTLSREISNRILRLDDGTENGRLMARICGLVFLIRKLSRERGVDTGVRANEEMLGDLLVEDLGADGNKIRAALPGLLKKLVEDGALLFDGGEYNLQTRESAEWDDQFRLQVTKLRQDTAALSHERKARLKAIVDGVLKAIKLRQGSSQTPRQLRIEFGFEAPDESDTDVPVWVRDGWEANEKEIVAAARTAGSDSATIFVFLPQSREDSVRESILRMKAAQAVLDTKGVPTSSQAEEARDAMEARRKDAERNLDQIARDILSSSKVFKGGGTELHALELIDKVQDAAEDSLNRLFPRFHEADHKAWEVAIRRARQGDDTPLQAVGWPGATGDHPVAKEILHYVAAGKEGRHIRAHFEKPPFGWPKDAIDGTLITLHSAGELLAIDSRSNEAIQPRHLDQNRISKADFRRESLTLTAKDRIALKGLFQPAGISVKPSDDLAAKADEYLARLLNLAQVASGPSPLPAKPSIAHIEDLRRLAGNERLAGILQRSATLQQETGDWKKLSELREKRLPLWERLGDLLQHGDKLPALDELRESAAAIEKDRLLLDGTDHVSPILRKAADVLRASLTEARKAHAETREAEWKRLTANDAWNGLSEEQQAALLAGSPLPESDASPIGTDEELLAALRATPLSQWRDRIDALSGRVDGLLAAAAKLLEPKAQRVTLPSSTLHSNEDLEEWLDQVRKSVRKKLKEGPVIV